MSFAPQKLEELRKMLHDINVTDEEITNGVRLTPKGMREVAQTFRIETHAVIDMLTALKKHVADDLSLTEDEERYSSEADYMGSLTLRDSETGKDVFLQGDEATVLANQIAAHPDMEQQLIAQYFDGSQLNEFVEPVSDTPDHSTPKSTMNFPYKGMIATAQFWLDSRGNLNFHTFNLMSTGTEEDHDITPELQDTLDKLAEKFAQKMRMGA